MQIDEIQRKVYSMPVDEFLSKLGCAGELVTIQILSPSRTMPPGPNNPIEGLVIITHTPNPAHAPTEKNAIKTEG